METWAAELFSVSPWRGQCTSTTQEPAADADSLQLQHSMQVSFNSSHALFLLPDAHR